LFARGCPSFPPFLPLACIPPFSCT
jgi:hypothetical protein